MSAHVPAALRQRVWERASGLCEYCLLHERDDWLAFQIDHLISRKHGGRTAYSNLALACSDCNLAKGPDLGSLTRRSGVLMPFFNPRKDSWTDHFRLNGHRIMGLNSPKRLVKRLVISRAGRYPSIEALALMRE